MKKLIHSMESHEIDIIELKEEDAIRYTNSIPVDMEVTMYHCMTS